MFGLELRDERGRVMVRAHRNEARVESIEHVCPQTDTTVRLRVESREGRGAVWLLWHSRIGPPPPPPRSVGVFTPYD